MYLEPTASRMPDRTPKGWHWSDGADPDACSPPTPDLIETDNPVVAVLLGPSGEPLRTWRERPPFGFR